MQSQDQVINTKNSHHPSTRLIVFCLFVYLALIALSLCIYVPYSFWGTAVAICFYNYHSYC